MVANGSRQDRPHRLPSPHQPRRRRDCLDESVQIDGSEHALFENRDALCTLLALLWIMRRAIDAGAFPPSWPPADPNRSRLGGSNPVGFVFAYDWFPWMARCGGNVYPPASRGGLTMVVRSREC